MSQEPPPEWAQALVDRLDKIEHAVNNCVMTRLDEIKQEVSTLTQEVSTLAESRDDLRGMKGKVDELWSHFLGGNSG